MSTALPNQPLPMIDTLEVEHARALGVLSVTREAGRVSLPLAGVQISARVADRVAGVTVTETFRNPYSEHLEAVYIFPLAGGAAVSDFEMKVGDRTIRGVVKERTEARQAYQQALEEGRRAALLEQERDDVFTVQVGNLPPGEEVTVKISYSERLPFYENGTTELRLPLVVAPRYIPGAAIDRGAAGDGIEEDTDIVPDASRITPPRLAPGFDPKIALGLEVEIMSGIADAGSVDDLSCSQHATRTSLGAEGVRVALAREDEALDRDFVLRWRLAGEAVKPSFLVYGGREGGAYGMLSIVPPRRDGFLGTPRDVVFVVDRSGSMGGVKMGSAARACSLLLGTLGPRDRFAIQAFDDRVEWLSKAGSQSADFYAADEAGVEKGDAYLRKVEARGGTELDAAIGAAIRALGSRGDSGGRAPVIVVLTDGEIGDESRVLKRIQQELGDARVFTVGIDTAVNDGFLRRLASLGGGTATFVEPGLQLEEALRAVGREIGRPLVVDVKVEDVDAGVERDSVAPARMPDLFEGRATTAFFKVKAARKGAKVRVRGRFADGGEFDETIEAREAPLPAIGHLWARTRIGELEDRFRVETGSQAQIKQQIVDLSIAHTLLTRFTAFVVVDETEVVNPDGTRRKVVQPVSMPARWEMEVSDMTLTGSAVTGALPTFAAPGAVPPPAAMPVMRSPMPASPAMAPPPPPMQPPTQPMARPASGAPGGGGVAKKLADALGDVFGKRRQAPQPPPLKAQPMPVSAEKMKDVLQSPAASNEDRRAISSALAAFERALTAAKSELDAGRVPPAGPVEATRKALLKALAGSNVATETPALQRFLRSSAVEIVAALGAPGVSAADVLAVFARHAKAFEDAKAETVARLGKSGDPGSFWEGSI